ncbi:unnamed protein product [Ambrosiozyma monospora]|uniref:Unnamed protein product n=1 Tax=Ambrosiozyma monospora TaxID=43982 RepID=A0ACB5UCZ1_AMBMO|nr:unnamed protein product [Ambrosiozyma monospora]
MFSRAIQRQTRQTTRLFSTASKQLNHHGPSGPYSNLPFKVHNRRIPYAVPHTLFFGMYHDIKTNKF